jgi:hypothetical protein
MADFESLLRYQQVKYDDTQPACQLQEPDQYKPSQIENPFSWP